MIICAAQAKPIKGNIEHNIANHKKLIELAVSQQADMIIFPELSLTGYEPSLAKDLATDIDDSRFDIFQDLSNSGNITICVGMPIKQQAGVCIGMIIFQPSQPRVLNAKQYLHADEEPFFIPGINLKTLTVSDEKIALAICYEISVPQHTATVLSQEPGYYMASVAKTSKGVEASLPLLTDIARKHSTIVILANGIGTCDGETCAGQSSVWGKHGNLLAQLNDLMKVCFYITLRKKKCMQYIQQLYDISRCGVN